MLAAKDTGVGGSDSASGKNGCSLSSSLGEARASTIARTGFGVNILSEMPWKKRLKRRFGAASSFRVGEFSSPPSAPEDCEPPADGDCASTPALALLGISSRRSCAARFLSAAVGLLGPLHADLRLLVIFGFLFRRPLIIIAEAAAIFLAIFGAGQGLCEVRHAVELEADARGGWLLLHDALLVLARAVVVVFVWVLGLWLLAEVVGAQRQRGVDGDDVEEVCQTPEEDDQSVRREPHVGALVQVAASRLEHDGAQADETRAEEQHSLDRVVVQEVLEHARGGGTLPLEDVVRLHETRLTQPHLLRSGLQALPVLLAQDHKGVDVVRQKLGVLLQDVVVLAGGHVRLGA
eukprot:scaffold645_cov247-Pinguiococcus_pyrenoidosus.AAC.18